MNSDLLKQRNLVDSFLKKRPRFLSAFSFVNMFLWKDFFDFKMEMIEESLCIFARSSLGCFMYFPPLGQELSAGVIDECFEMMYTANNGKGVSRIENIEEEELKFFNREKFSCFKKGEEYIYRRKDIVSLQGNPFKAKRSSYNYFVKNYRYALLPFKDDMKKDCEALFESWADERNASHRDEVYRQMIDDNRLVHRLAMRHYEDLGLIGRAVCIDDKIKAYTFGFALNTKTFCVLFEIADLSFKGLPVFIFREFCKDREIQKFDFINVMDDFELGNIKRTKLSFRPCQIIPSYAVSKKEEK